jgi:GxxExxY protein
MIDIELYNPLTEKIIATALEVHKILGCGFLESVYQKSMEHELSLREISFSAQMSLDVHYKNILAGHFVPDLIVFDSIVVELKAQENINYDFVQMQIINYLVASNIQVGLLLNFGKTSLETKRYIIPQKFQTNLDRSL